MVIWLVYFVWATNQVDVVGPAGSGEFGKEIRMLPNGNIVVIDPYYDAGAIVDVGAVYLYDGATGDLISMLTGSSENDHIGAAPRFDDQLMVYIEILPNGNFLIRSPLWDNGIAANAGAVTWINGETGLSGTVSSTNSLVGSTADDLIGTIRGRSKIKILSNGNYLVNSPYWDNGTAVDVGAVTWGDGATGISGTISSLNSLIGETTDDQVGWSLFELANGNYFIRSPYWNNGVMEDAGAITWSNGSAGITGTVSTANSLVGSTAGDQVGLGISYDSHPNGNYILFSPDWDNGIIEDAGAVTWIDGTTGLTGTINSNNSLIGSSIGDRVGSGRIKLLNNGNYLILSPDWDNGLIEDAGAVTWIDEATIITGTISSTNSLVGSSSNSKYELSQVQVPVGQT